MTSNNDETNDSDASSTQPTLNEIRAHHEDTKEALEPLADIDGHPTIIQNDKWGWYTTEDNETPSEEEMVNGWDYYRRARRFDEDYDSTVDQLERTLYTTTSYNYNGAFEPVLARRNGDKWQHKGGGKPTPGSEATVAISAWVDMDLHDGLKTRRDELSDGEYETIEATYDVFINELAAMVGGRDAVFALDSVGGGYVMTAPAATGAFTSHFGEDRERCALVMSEFIDRSEEFMKHAMDRVYDEVGGAEDLLNPDFVNNINRPYKMPLAVHGDVDAVVTPIDTDDIEYREPTGLQNVDDALLSHVEEWARNFTNTDYQDRVEDIVATLWSDEYDEHDGDWEAAIDAWADEKIEAKRKAEKEREEIRGRLKQRRESGNAIQGVGVCSDKAEVQEIASQVPIKEIAEEYATTEWEPTGRKNHFDPVWKNSDSGTSVFVNEEENIFGDVGNTNGGGGPGKLMALAEGIISDPSVKPTGQEWWMAVDALRDAGYEIPVYVPEVGDTNSAGNEYERTPLWAVVEGAKALDALPDSAFVTHVGDDGGLYEALAGDATLRIALEALEDAGLKHGWEKPEPTIAEETNARLADRYAGTDLGDRLDSILDDYKEAIEFEYPVYAVNDWVEMHFIPRTGTNFDAILAAARDTQGVEEGEILTTMSISHKPDRPDHPHDLDTPHKRTLKASTLSDEAGLSKREVKDVLTEFANDITQHEEDGKHHPPVLRFLKKQQQHILAYPSEVPGQSTIYVEFASDPRRPSRGTQSFDLPTDMVRNNSPEPFLGLYYGKYLARIEELDSASWNILTMSWDDAPLAEGEKDTDRAAIMDALIDAIDNKFDVYADTPAGRDSFETTKPRGLYVEDFENEDGEEVDVILVPGAWLTDFKREQKYEGKLERELRQHGYLANPSYREASKFDSRVSVWPVVAEKSLKWDEGKDPKDLTAPNANPNGAGDN